MSVSKESISKFFIGNQFHVKLRILSRYSNRIQITIWCQTKFLTSAKFLTYDFLSVILLLRVQEYSFAISFLMFVV